MKTISFALLLMASLAFVLMGCSDNSGPLLAPTDQAGSSPTSPMVPAKVGVQHSVTGSAHTYNMEIYDPVMGWAFVPAPKQKGGVYNVVTINAIDHGDGTFSGKYISQLMGAVPPGLVGFASKVEAKVIQLQLDETGTMAKVVCEITKWIGIPLPAWMIIVFVDKGEGATSERDEESSYWATLDPAERDTWLAWTPQEYLDWEWGIIQPMFPDLGATFPIDNGNIQIR